MLPWPVAILLAVDAGAVGGALVGPAGDALAISSATDVVFATSPDGGLSVTISARLDRDVDTVALLWPVPAGSASGLAQAQPARLDRLEEWTRPRLQRVSCDAVVATTYVHTVDGCRTYERQPPPTIDLEFSVDEVPRAGPWAEVNIAPEVVPASELAAWLDTHALELPPGVEAELQPWLDSNADIVTARAITEVAAGSWLNPVRFDLATSDVVLPLRLGAADAAAPHDLWVHFLDAPDAPQGRIANFGEAVAETDCMLAPGSTVSDVYAAALQPLSSGPVPQFLTEYVGPADACDPCTSEPLEDLIVADLGRDALSADTWITRVRMRWNVGDLDQDIQLTTRPPGVPTQLTWIQHDPDLEFALPICGQGFADDPGVCPGVDAKPIGCSLGPRAPLAGAALAMAMLGLRRRRRWVAIPLMLVTISSARASDRKRIDPRTEFHAALPVWSTERVVFEGVQKGAPFYGNPLLGIEARRVVWGWRDGANIGVIGGVRGFRGRARVPDSGVRFVLVEPAVGLDARHGRFVEGQLLSPKLRYGVQLAASVLDSSVYRPRATVGAQFLAAAGAWVGRGATQWSVEGRLTVVPRTDGYDTTFLPSAGIPSWQYSAGSAVAQIWIGAAFN